MSRCKKQFKLDEESTPRRCVLDDDHPSTIPHWKGLVEWFDDSVDTDRFGSPGHRVEDSTEK